MGAIEGNNLNKVTVKLRSLSRTSAERIKGILEFHAGRGVSAAKAAAPGSGDQVATKGGSKDYDKIVRGRSWTSIHQAIGYKVENDGYKVSMFVDKSAGDIAAWVEFGTGQSAQAYLATVPEEWRTLAKQYIRNGRGTILDQPYFLPAAQKAAKDAKAEIISFVKSLTI